jgi:hypothetical protein
LAGLEFFAVASLVCGFFSDYNSCAAEDTTGVLFGSSGVSAMVAWLLATDTPEQCPMSETVEIMKIDFQLLCFGNASGLLKFTENFHGQVL